METSAFTFVPILLRPSEQKRRRVSFSSPVCVATSLPLCRVHPAPAAVFAARLLLYGELLNARRLKLVSDRVIQSWR